MFWTTPRVSSRAPDITDRLVPASAASRRPDWISPPSASAELLFRLTRSPAAIVPAVTIALPDTETRELDSSRDPASSATLRSAPTPTVKAPPDWASPLPVRLKPLIGRVTEGSLSASLRLAKASVPLAITLPAIVLVSDVMEALPPAISDVPALTFASPATEIVTWPAVAGLKSSPAATEPAPVRSRLRARFAPSRT